MAFLYKIDGSVVYYKSGLDYTLLRAQLESGDKVGYDFDGVPMAPYDALSDLALYSSRRGGDVLQSQMQANILLASSLVTIFTMDASSLGADASQRYLKALCNVIDMVRQGQYEMAATAMGYVRLDDFYTADRISRYQALIRSADATPYAPVDYHPVPEASLSYQGHGVAQSMVAGVTGYLQSILQNTVKGPQASTDMVVNNDLSTDSAYYGDFGINSSGFTGAGSFSLPNATYLAANSGELVIGTDSQNGIHLVVNDGASDVMTVDPLGTTVLFNATLSTTKAILDSSGLTGTIGQALIKNADGTQSWLTAAAGTTGARGITGAAGSQGPTGSQGVQGTTGTWGITGRQGITGTQGIQGVQGVTGTQGLQGTQGATGAIGVQGITGNQGVQGTQGINGVQGLTGTSGITGAQGLQGLTGTSGITGAQGLQGLTGASTPLIIFGTTGTFTAPITFATSSATMQSLILPHGGAPTTPTNGSMWTTSTAATGFQVQIGGATKTVCDLNSSQTLSAKTLSAPVFSGTATGTLTHSGTHSNTSAGGITARELAQTVQTSATTTGAITWTLTSGANMYLSAALTGTVTMNITAPVIGSTSELCFTQGDTAQGVTLSMASVVFIQTGVVNSGTGTLNLALETIASVGASYKVDLLWETLTLCYVSVHSNSRPDSVLSIAGTNQVLTVEVVTAMPAVGSRVANRLYFLIG